MLVQKLCPALFVFLAFCLEIVFLAAPAHAQTLTLLYSFQGGADGTNPQGALVRDAAGNLYGTTEEGGTFNEGTVFKIDSTGHETVLHSFGATGDGFFPYCALVLDKAGNLYGAAPYGGSSGQGAIFKVDSSGNETILHNFTGPPDGQAPYGSLIRDGAGSLYGMTSEGGAIGYGAVYKLDTSGQLTVLYSFLGPPDGDSPQFGALVRDMSGNFYGTVYTGGANGFGIVFKLDTSGNETILHNFTGHADGVSPVSSLLLSSGKLYGTTAGGVGFGSGTVFEVSPNGQFRTLHTFHKSDGQFITAGVIRDSTGNLYGTAQEGGATGSGVVFELSPTGTLTLLHSFGFAPDGNFPSGGLIRDAAGNLYGTTQMGGTFGYGTVFMLTP